MEPINNKPSNDVQQPQQMAQQVPTWGVRIIWADEHGRPAQLNRSVEASNWVGAVTDVCAQSNIDMARLFLVTAQHSTLTVTP